MSDYDVKFDSSNKNHCWSLAFEHIAQDAKVLDVGCSKGAFAEELRTQKNCVVDGVEPDPGDAAIAEKKVRKLYAGTVEDTVDLIIKDNKKYDHIVFLDVIEHLSNPVDSLRSIKSLLKKNGSIVFSIPNMAHVSVRLMLLDGRLEYGRTGLLDNTHLHFYTKQEILRIFKESGLTPTAWSFTEATYSEDMIRKEIVKLGFEPTKKAINQLIEDDARAFQYVGAAKVGQYQSEKIADYSPDPQGQINKYHEAATEKIRKENLSLRNHTLVLDEEKMEVERRLSELTSSKGFAILRHAARFYRFIRYPRTTIKTLYRRLFRR